MGCWNKIGPTQIACTNRIAPSEEDCTDVITGVIDGEIPEDEIEVIPPSEIDPEVPVPSIVYTTSVISGVGKNFGWMRKPAGFSLVSGGEFALPPLYLELRINSSSNPNDPVGTNVISGTSLADGSDVWTRNLTSAFIPDTSFGNATHFTFLDNKKTSESDPWASSYESLVFHQPRGWITTSVTIAAQRSKAILSLDNEFYYPSGGGSSLGSFVEPPAWRGPEWLSCASSFQVGELRHQTAHATSQGVSDQTEIPWVHLRDEFTYYRIFDEVPQRKSRPANVISAGTDCYTTKWYWNTAYIFASPITIWPGYTKETPYNFIFGRALRVDLDVTDVIIGEVYEVIFSFDEYDITGVGPPGTKTGEFQQTYAVAMPQSGDFSIRFDGPITQENQRFDLTNVEINHTPSASATDIVYVLDDGSYSLNG